MTEKPISTVVWRKEGVKGGKPLLKGTRVPVDTILRHLSLGWSVTELSELFPAVNAKHVSKLLRDITKDFGKK
jgi:uncharacterized protein (DUF433 family)